MATVTTTMVSLGIEPPCQRCETSWERGHIMTAVENDAGEPMGWFCQDCISKWPTSQNHPRKEDETP